MTNRLSISDAAADRINKLTLNDLEGSVLRIEVDAGGCSGFKYNFRFEANALEHDDLLIERNGARVVVDSISMSFLDGAQLDFVETLGESFFEIKNPNAKASCGCGNSFSI
jgi:iron-sulfur cluster assembly accessory protein